MHSHNHTWLLALSLLIVVFAACAKPGPQQLPPIPPGPFEITGISSECSVEQTPLQVIAWSGAEHAETYLFFRGDQQIAELAVGELQYRDGEKLTPGSVVSYRVRAVNTDGQRDSPAVSYTVPEDQCAAPEEPGDPTDPGQPDDPEDPADPEDPVEPPEEAGALQVAITCTPLASATFNWEPVERADRYDLLQGDTVIAELDAKASQANAVEMIPGLAFEFSLRAGNSAGTTLSEPAEPDLAFEGCLPESALLGAGWQDVLLIADDGTAWGWGNNHNHILAMGRDGIFRPTQSSSMPDNVRQLELALSHAMALLDDGTMRAWGTAPGRLGMPDASRATEPTVIPGLVDIVSFAMSDTHALAVDKRGQVWVWGQGLTEQPSPVPLATGAITVAAGNNTSYATLADGSVISWGENALTDLLGHGGNEPQAEPKPIPGLSGVTDIAASSEFVLLLRADGSVAGLGQSRLTGGTAGAVPADVPSPAGVQQLAVGLDFALALDPNGQVYAWGSNVSGQLGVEGIGFRSEPAIVPGLASVTTIHAGFRFGLAVDNAGALHGWGNNIAGQLGLNMPTFRWMFEELELERNAVQAALGNNFVLVLGEDERVYSWGNNDHGQLGRSSDPEQSWKPDKLYSLSGVIQVAAGENFGLALDSDGYVYSWGSSADGRLGHGSTEPAIVENPTRIETLSDIEKIWAGRDYATAIDGSGTIWRWGNGATGALGSGGTFDLLSPVAVTYMLSDAADVALGDGFSLFLRSDGVIFGSGDNSDLQLSNNHSADATVLTIQKVHETADGFVKVFAGHSTSFAVTATGELYAWGRNSGGLLQRTAIGIEAGELERVDSVSNVGMLSVASRHAIATNSASGLAYGWGEAPNGQFGLGRSQTNANTPVLLPFPGPVTDVVTSQKVSALIQGNRLYLSGQNLNGMLGLPRSSDIFEPRLLLLPVGLTVP